jgi:hypothetical protein
MGQGARMKTWRMTVAAFAVVCMLSGCKKVGCENDNDCKGERVCSDGQCVDRLFPQQPSPAQTVARNPCPRPPRASFQTLRRHSSGLRSRAPQLLRALVRSAVRAAMTASTRPIPSRRQIQPGQRTLPRRSAPPPARRERRPGCDATATAFCWINLSGLARPLLRRRHSTSVRGPPLW